MTSKRIWFTWEKQVRNTGLSNLANAKLIELSTKRTGFSRYFYLTSETYKVLKKERPETLFVQNPSLVLAFFSVIAKIRFGYKLVVDQHNAGIFPIEGKSKILTRVANYIIRSCDLNIVTNKYLSEYCENRSGRAVIIEDILPELQNSTAAPKNGDIKFVYICSWASDEPFDNVIAAFIELETNNIRLEITGNSKLNEKNFNASNIQLTGYLDRDKYIQTLNKADALIVLTTRENCLTCGAYEAVSLKKPGILTNTDVIRNYFNKGFLYTDNSKDDIKEVVLNICKSIERLKEEVNDLNAELLCKDNMKKKILDDALAEIEG